MDALDFDLDVDTDIDMDIDMDIDVDIDVDVDVTLLGSQKALNTPKRSFFVRCLVFFNFGRIPFMIISSFLLLTMWSISVYCNNDASWLNPSNSISMAALLFLPNLLFSLFFTKLITTPLAPIFAKLNSASKQLVYTGKIGTLMTSIQDTETGQLKIDIDGSVIALNVKSNEGKSIKKGAKAVIVEQIEEGKSYIVQKIDFQ